MKPTLPLRLCEHDNHEWGRNPIMEMVAGLLDEHLGALAHVSDALLDSLYVRDRYSGGAKKGRLAAEDSLQFEPNLVVRWSEADQRFRADDINSSEMAGWSQDISDCAQAAALNTLAQMVKMLLRTRSQNHAERDLPAAQRLLFIQGGMGSGKSTMLLHLRRVTIPRLNKASTLAAQILPITVDLNDHSFDEPINIVWPRIIHEFRERLALVEKLDTTEGWRHISAAELRDKYGNPTPTVHYSANPREEERRIIHQCSDDLVFLKRVARTIADRTPSAILLLTLDNIDRVPVRLRQLSLIDRFSALLREIREALGFIAVRRNTLGALAHLKRIAGHLHVRRLFITAPRIGDIFQKRIDMIAGQLESRAIGQSVRISQRVTVNLADVRSILSHIATSFATSTGNLDSGIGRAQVPANSIERFLPYAFHTNVRGALGFLHSALESWALRYESVVTEYLFQRDRRKTISLPRFGVDELLRLGSIGRYRYFDHLNESGLFNVFCFRRMKPDSQAGRFPLLLLYRSIQYFAKVGRAKKADFLDVLKCFGCALNERERVLSILVDGLFLESPEGLELSKIVTITRTKKLEYYYETLCHKLCYLETIRNDSIIEYEAKPREATDSLAGDLGQICLFTRYMLSQEIREWSYVQRQGNGHVRRYKEIAFDIPASARIYRSVVQRALDIVRWHPHLLEKEQRLTLERNFDTLRLELISASRKNEIWPSNFVEKLTQLNFLNTGKPEES